MPRLPYVTLDVFTTTPLVAGNPLAVVTIPEGTTITKHQEHLIAREFNYSETTFIYPATFIPANAAIATSAGSEKTTRIAIWTTDQELPFAGHPTVGTAWYLRETGEEKYSGEGGFDVDILAGRLKVSRGTGGRKVRIDTPHKVKTWQKRISQQRIAEAVTLPGDVPFGNIFGPSCAQSIPVQAIVDGMNFALLEVANVEVLSKLKPGKKETRLSMAGDLEYTPKSGERPFVGIYVYTIVNEMDGKLEVRARMFYDGDQEDPATGSAACALSTYLALTRGGDDDWEFSVTQGVEMGRRSDIGVKVQLVNEQVNKVFLEGDAVKVMEGFLNI